MDKLLFIFLISSIGLIKITGSSPQVYNFHSFHNVRNTLPLSTLDKVKIIRHIPSGKCLIIENRDPAVGRRGDRVVLWECHDVKHIAGLEQEMFTFLRGLDNGFMMMGLASSLDHCVFAGREYYDTVEVGKCDPRNAYQSWTFRRVQGTVDSYQIMHLVSGRCLRVISAHDGAWIRSGDCNMNDPDQTWRVCALDKDCTFTI